MAPLVALALVAIAYETPITPLVESCAIAPHRDDRAGPRGTFPLLVGIGPQD